MMERKSTTPALEYAGKGIVLLEEKTTVLK
jgi:hypothetical protein